MARDIPDMRQISWMFPSVFDTRLLKYSFSVVSISSLRVGRDSNIWLLSSKEGFSSVLGAIVSRTIDPQSPIQNPKLFLVQHFSNCIGNHLHHNWFHNKSTDSHFFGPVLVDLSYRSSCETRYAGSVF